MRPAPVAIVGPTGVGKSSAAESLAVLLRGEIVNADSMQVYRGMDIGTAKVPPDQRRVPHHCIDLVRPGQPYSAALYQRDAREAIASIAARGAVPIVVGGTGLYVRAALDRFEFPPGEIGGDARERYERLAAELGAEGLHRLLRERDPAGAAAIHPNNVRRVIRALEMADAGRLYGEHVAGFARREPYYPHTVFLGLTMARDELYARIERRVDDMIAEGLLDEVARLLAAGYREALTAAQAIGYKELVPVLDGAASLEAAIAAIKQATRRYAKRQLTWFRADERVRWLDVTGLASDEVTTGLLRLLESSGRIR